MVKDILQQLAKAELHCHLDGSLSLECIRQLAAMAQVDIPESDLELKSLVSAPKNAKNLMDYLKSFDIIRPLLQTEKALSLAAYDVAKQAAKEHVIYIEVRFAPELSMDQGLTAIQTVAAVEKGLRQAQKDFGIVAKALICGMKQSHQKKTKSIFKSLLQSESLDFVGFDFAGNELDFPPENFADIIHDVQHADYPMTFHAGECGCPHYIAQSLALGIKRLGHITAICHQPDLLAELVQQGVTAELCLTSNLQTKAAASIADFPYRELYELGAKITINTDNRTVSDTSLTKEYHHFQELFATTVSDFYQFNQNALEAAFASEYEKKELLTQLAKSYEKFLK
ncbi:adenosine deaminase [Streptococcus macacae]|uniref:Adenosine deaminase n=1 Tax=Streptococcus macacae NCTC 11558 TaxID=764298 RepID=G5JYV0_9STRE|nr:adenosine deaminase [Streptococcus macacae]EHJ52703.1 adenosine deaminase [Streptococcus macacae NCTC 11558]SUN78207.1 adenosine deaminase [Streptococcus macacae NCTC 11558]